VRYLTRAFALGALRRGQGIEQFLGPAQIDGAAAVRWVSVSPIRGGRLVVTLHTVADPDDDTFLDLANFLSLDPVDEDHVGQGRELGWFDDPEQAIEAAERLTDAVPDRWVNFSVAGEEYADFVRARRQHT